MYNAPALLTLAFVLYERLQEREKDMGSSAFYGDCLTLTQMQTEVEFFLKSRQLFSPEERQLEAERFLELMRTETGLIVKRGRDESGEDLYGFIHRTFQEYFAALDIYFRQADPPHPDLPGENANIILNTFLTRHLHDPYWQEVILLLFGKLGPVRATMQIQMILNPPDGKVCCRSNYTEIIQQDLFFACACLQEEITVQNNLAREIVARLSKLDTDITILLHNVYMLLMHLPRCSKRNNIASWDVQHCSIYWHRTLFPRTSEFRLHRRSAGTYLLPMN